VFWKNQNVQNERWQKKNKIDLILISVINLRIHFLGLPVTVRGFAKWREIEVKSFDLDDT